MLLKELLITCLLFAIKIKCERICAIGNNDAACQQIPRNQEFACNYYLHNVDCLLAINSNISHVGRITGEQALLGANLLSDNVVVLGEITTRHPVTQTVVIVKSDIPNGFTNLKGKKFCHPGFKYDTRLSNLILEEFENEIIKQNNSYCSDGDITLVERHVGSIGNFFGDSCRPGPWTQDIELDAKLKSKYNTLCNLCFQQNCNATYANPFRDSLTCLTDNDADVAVTTLSEAQKFFNSTKRSNYKYLCKDGSSSLNPEQCFWSTQLPDLIVAERQVAKEVTKYLQNNLGSKIHNLVGTPGVSNQAIEQSLTSILNLEFYEKISLLSRTGSYQSLKEYVTKRRTVPTAANSKQCDRTLKWCTYTDLEQEKCRWLSQAALNWGIQPVVECVRSEGDDELSCLDDIKKKKADIVVTSSDYAYISLNKGLKTIAYPETDTRYLSTVLAVKRADDSSINKFEDLRGKKACFPRFGGKEHLTFIDTLRSKKIVDDANCDYGKLLSEFVSSSCVPGVRSLLIKESTKFADKDELCSTCRSINVSRTATFCNDDVRNKYFGSKGALQCLYDKSGDFAVISKTDVDTTNNYNYTVICKNNVISTKRGLDVDDDCALNIIPSSEVVSEVNNVKNKDIILALHEFEIWFGQNLKKPFNLFDRFNGTLDLLFRDSTPGLSFTDSRDYMRNYQELLKRAKNCKDNNNSTTVKKASVFILMVSLFVYIINLP